MVSGDFCEHDWPGSGCRECASKYGWSKSIVTATPPTAETTPDRPSFDDLTPRQKINAEALFNATAGGADDTLMDMAASIACHQATYVDRALAEADHSPAPGSDDAVRLDVLRSLEWSATSGRGGFGSFPVCPVCDGAKSTGHDPDCRLKAALSSRPAREIGGMAVITKAMKRAGYKAFSATRSMPGERQKGWEHAVEIYEAMERARLAEDPAPRQSRLATGTQAALDVLAERRAQVEAEGWTPEYDDGYSLGELASAAACYAHHASMPDDLRAGYERKGSTRGWPFDRAWWKPTGRRRDLVKAGALILAEIERLDRNSLRQSGAAAHALKTNEAGHE